MFESILNKMATTIVKPMLEAEYKKGYSAGVSAEKLVKEKEWAKREYDLLSRGREMGREEMLQEMKDDIEEITAREFEELANLDKEPFGFVGDMDHMSLVLDDMNILEADI